MTKSRTLSICDNRNGTSNLTDISYLTKMNFKNYHNLCCKGKHYLIFPVFARLCLPRQIINNYNNKYQGVKNFTLVARSTRE